MDSVWHVSAEDINGDRSFSRYYSSREWAARKVFQLKRDTGVSRVGFKVLRGKWEDCDV
jgi:hypothetical protein